MILLQKISSFLFLLSLCLVPIPLFIDLANLELVINKGPFSSNPKIPLPVSIISISVSYILLYFVSNRRKILFFFKTNKSLTLISLAILFIIYAIIISGLIPVRAVQLIFFIIPVLCFIKVNNPVLEGKIIFYFLLSPACFFCLHIVSIYVMYVNGEIVDILSNVNFVLFWGYDIYQGLVSYCGVLFIYSTISLFIILFSNFSRKLKLLSAILFISSLFLLFASGRKIALVEFFLLFTLVILNFIRLSFYYNKINGTLILKKKALPLLIMIVFICFSASYYIFNSMSYYRLFDQIAIKSWVFPRSLHWVEGLNYITKDVHTFFLGNFISGTPGFHNYFLDTTARVGVVGLLIIIILLFLSINYVKVFYTAYQNIDSSVKYLFVLLALALFIQSFVNSAFSQPYYILNLFFVVAIALNISNRQAINRN
jgi:hypothetical protein